MYRQLGNDEQFTWLYEQTRSVTFTLTANIIGIFTLDQLQQSLLKVQTRHPLLNVRIDLDQSGIPWFVTDSVQIPVRLIERHNPQQWQKEVERELKTLFDWNKAPLIRVVLLKGNDISDLIVSCDRVIGDAMSVMFLLRDILQALGLPDSELSILPEHPPYEHLVSQSKQNQGFQTLSFKPPLTTTKIPRTLPEKCCPTLHTWSLSNTETIKIINKCQKAKTSVHAAICAAFLLAVAEQNMQSNNLEISNLFKCFSPISIRPFLSEIEEDFGFYATYLLIVEAITPNLSLWELARSIKTKLNQKLEPENIFDRIPGSEAFLSTRPSPNEVVNMMESVNSYDVIVSNLGRVKFSQQYGKLQLTSIYGPSFTTHFSNDIVIGVTTLEDRMFYSLVHSQLEVSSAQIVQLQTKAMQFLNDAIDFTTR
jgi:Condensation domain